MKYAHINNQTDKTKGWGLFEGYKRVAFEKAGDVVTISGVQYLAVDCISAAVNAYGNKESKAWQSFLQYAKDSRSGSAYSFTILKRKNGYKGWTIALYLIDKIEV